DVCKIKALGSQNSSLIRLGAIIGLTKAITHSDLSYQIDILVSIINLNYYKKFNTIQKNLDAFKNTANIKFIIDNAIIFANAEKIANYNKEEPRNLSKAKTTQYIWLAVNKLIPYAAFAFIRKFNENCKISDIFTDYKKLKKRSFQSYTTIRTIASISEIIRQIALQCLENCQYKKHQTNDVNKNR
ncbi:MAG: hypothetical protein M0R03_16675, partial [Novosphingobium sp.]|nr:hypothetical protein [Novosphingobium sp.]